MWFGMGNSDQNTGMANKTTTTFDAYDREADSLAARYESKAFEEIHSDVLDLLPDSSGLVLDIGAGSGRDSGLVHHPWT